MQLGARSSSRSSVVALLTAAVLGAGCGAERFAAREQETVRRMAAAALDCPADALQVGPIERDEYQSAVQATVTGCGQRTTLVFFPHDDRWLPTSTRPAQRPPSPSP